MKKLIASDFDGTLRRNREILREDIAAIEKWRAEGNIFGVVTGRAICSIRQELENSGVSCDFIAANNGGQIFGASGEELYGRAVDGAHLAAITEYIYKAGGTVCGAAVGENHTLLFDRRADNPEIDTEKLEAIKQVNQVNTYFPTADEARDFAESVRRDFNGIFNALQNGNCVDIPPYGVTKATGTAEVARLFGVKREHVTTVGDNYNDLEMIAEFKGAAVINAREEIKAAASVTVNDFTELTEYAKKNR